MDPSKWKLEVYDLLAIILPGLVAISEGWVLVRGWDSFTLAVEVLTATRLTLLILVAFGAGTIVQELSDLFVKQLKGERYFKRGRDEFWRTDQSVVVKRAIKSQLGMSISCVDMAFNFCLTRLKGQFARRDVFIANSDLCRSFAVLSLLAIIPAIRITFQTFGLHRAFFVWTVATLIASTVLFTLSWRRMVRFRELSDTTVFHAYLSTVNDPPQPSESARRVQKEEVHERDLP